MKYSLPNWKKPLSSNFAPKQEKSNLENSFVLSLNLQLQTLNPQMSKTLESPRNHQTLQIIKSAITSRLLLLSLILLWRTLIDPYDTSSPLDPNCLSTDHQQQERHVIQFPRIGSAIEDSIVWDGVYFVRIAQCGYEYEQTYAFLPLLPACVVLLSRTGAWILVFFTLFVRFLRFLDPNMNWVLLVFWLFCLISMILSFFKSYVEMVFFFGYFAIWVRFSSFLDHKLSSDFFIFG